MDKDKKPCWDTNCVKDKPICCLYCEEKDDCKDVCDQFDYCGWGKKE